MPQGKPTRKNPLGLGSNDYLRHWYRHQLKRDRAAQAVAAVQNRERAAQRQESRLDRRAVAAYTLERQIRLMDRYPSPLNVARLGEILRDPATPEEARVKAASLMLKLASHGDGPSPG
jgi:hypothetical protein